MQGAKFYQLNSAQAAISLQLVTALEWTNLKTTLDSFHANQLIWQSFSANQGEILLLLDQKGQLEKVYVGVQQGRIFFALGSAASKLNPGIYRLENEISTADLMAWGMAQYKFLRYKTIEVLPRILELSKQIFDQVVPRVDAVFRVRDLINTSAEDMGPKALGDMLESVAQLYHGTFSSIVGTELLEKNFPAIYAVGRAAVEAPRLLKLEWGKSKHPLVILVGKGVCFDSGGLDLKPASAMRQMKKDMGGAAQVIGLAQLIMHYQLPIRLMVLIPAVENTIDAAAYRPGDVLRMRNGLHVEIDNTDAEGRLVLADALVYACEQNPDWVLDLATLTGAARTAVGTEISALFTDEQPLASQLMALGREWNDPVWQLPMYEGYASMLDSVIADMTNSTSSPYAGSITAALFLKRFISPDVKWAHFDLMAWNISTKPGRPEGGEAMAVMSLFEYLRTTYA
jgi:leucyl aminopeptidase